MRILKKENTYLKFFKMIRRLGGPDEGVSALRNFRVGTLLTILLFEFTML